jgi:ankyrin repeat protein
LSKAIAGEDIPEMLRLLESGLDPNAADRQGETPLMYAAYRDRTESVRVLLGAGAEPNHQRLDGNTALHLAVDSAIDRATQDGEPIGEEQLRTIRLLLRAGARVDLRKTRGQTAVDWARAAEVRSVLLGPS